MPGAQRRLGGHLQGATRWGIEPSTSPHPGTSIMDSTPRERGETAQAGKGPEVMAHHKAMGDGLGQNFSEEGAEWEISEWFT